MNRSMKSVALAIVLMVAVHLGASANALTGTEGGGAGPGSNPPPVWDAWALFPPGCGESASRVIVECGDVGDYHLGRVVAPLGCTPTAAGHASLAVYVPSFPGGASPFLVPPVYFSVSGGGAASATTGGSGGIGHLASSMSSSDRPELDPGAPRWIGVVDFDDSHGWSTTYAADLAAAGTAQAQLVPLDSTELEPLGSEVTDFHVLGALCRVVDAVHDGRMPVPAAVNMSFGRVRASTDDSESCASGGVDCEVRRVLGALRTEGVSLVAAAGNHDELLFPASAPETIAVGRLDYLHSDGDSLWDSPTAADALVPGSHLCLSSAFAAPGGSSYSAALMTGLLAELLESHPEVDPHDDPAWRTRWSPQRACWVLTRPGSTPTTCNPELQALFDGLAGGWDTSCWQRGTVNSGVVEATVTAEAPVVPSFDFWTAEVQPTPTGDPCVPCEGQFVDDSPTSDLDVNMSSSQSLEPGVHLLRVYVRTKLGMTRLRLDRHTRELLATGQLDALKIEGVDWPRPIGESPQLWYLLSTGSDSNCQGRDRCYWDASSILIRGR